MWKKLDDVAKEELRSLRQMRKVRIYVDADIEEEVVQFLRDNKVNVEYARENGHRFKDDAFHAALAYRQKRMLLTKNKKHFLDDKALPFHRTYGVIGVSGDMSDIDAYARTILQIIWHIIPFGDVFNGFKISMSHLETVTRFIDSNGQLQTTRFRFQGSEAYQWVDD